MSNINSYVWRDARLTHDKNEQQVETKLVDMDEDQLQMVYSHCKEMLYNTDSKNEGRLVLIDRLNEQYDKCGAELALRWFKTLINSATGAPLYTSDSLYREIQGWTKSIPNYNDKEKYQLKHILEVPASYGNVLISDLMDACKDALGIFNHSKITYSFIYSQLGVYLTQEELKEIDKDLIIAGLDPEKITLQAKIENHVKLPLGLMNTEVKINPKGLTGTELRDLVNMKKFKGYRACKYSELTTSQLQTLRSKVLFALEQRTTLQAKKWKEIMTQIEEVAKYKKYKLN